VGHVLQTFSLNFNEAIKTSWGFAFPLYRGYILKLPTFCAPLTKRRFGAGSVSEAYKENIMFDGNPGVKSVYGYSSTSAFIFRYLEDVGFKPEYRRKNKKFQFKRLLGSSPKSLFLVSLFSEP
jgi:hypothetical protein